MDDRSDASVTYFVLNTLYKLFAAVAHVVGVPMHARLFCCVCVRAWGLRALTHIVLHAGRILQEAECVRCTRAALVADSFDRSHRGGSQLEGKADGKAASAAAAGSGSAAPLSASSPAEHGAALKVCALCDRAVLSAGCPRLLRRFAMLQAAPEDVIVFCFQHLHHEYSVRALQPSCAATRGSTAQLCFTGGHSARRRAVLGTLACVCVIPSRPGPGDQHQSLPSAFLQGVLSKHHLGLISTMFAERFTRMKKVRDCPCPCPLSVTRCVCCACSEDLNCSRSGAWQETDERESSTYQRAVSFLEFGVGSRASRPPSSLLCGSSSPGISVCLAAEKFKVTMQYLTALAEVSALPNAPPCTYAKDPHPPRHASACMCRT